MSVTNVIIREANDYDFEEIWDIFHQVVSSGNAYAYSPQTSKMEAYELWMPPHKNTYVALLKNKIVGTYFIKANQPGLGSHIANAGYMVHPEQRGKGIGSAIIKHSIEEAKKLDYSAMQFNMVVSMNKTAINLYKKLGFKIMGTIPQGFKHVSKGFVDIFIFHKFL